MTKGEASRERFEVAFNDGSRSNIKRLFGLKRVISEQLPNMPKEYILRVILERNHRSLLVIHYSKEEMKEKDPKNESGTVIGGIVFRPFHSQGFAEIVFLAISSKNMHKGYGTKLMNHLKEHVKEEGIKYFLTYADNTAIGFFVKQGFIKKKTMAKARWEGYIKDYVRSTLMECKILYNVDYLKVKEMLYKQKEIVKQKRDQLSTCHIRHKGLDIFPKGNTDRKDVVRIPIGDIPGVKEAGWTPSESQSKTLHRSSLLSGKLVTILNTIKKMAQAWPFLEPVKEEDVPGYHEIIKAPMDLSTMEKKLERGGYVTKEEFEADFNLIIKNCLIFNEKETVYAKNASTLENKFNVLFKRIVG